MLSSGASGGTGPEWASAGYDKGRRTRARLVAEASGLFAARGYEGTSMEQIARAAGMTKGALYAHFKRKRELYIACLEHNLAYLREPVEPAAGSEPDEALREWLHWFGSRLAERPTARSFFIQIVREEQDDQPKIDLIVGLLGEPYARLRALIEALNPGADSGAYAFLLFSVLLLGPDLHRYHVLLAGDPARSHTLDRTVDQLVAAVRSA